MRSLIAVLLCIYACHYSSMYLCKTTLLWQYIFFLTKNIFKQYSAADFSVFIFFCDCQCEFRPGMNTEISLATVTTDIFTANDQGLSSVLVLFDFSKELDTINCELLCSKFKYFSYLELFFKKFSKTNEQ